MRVLPVDESPNAGRETQFRLIVGLGNPGPEYRDTRHNIGFMIIDRMAAAAGATYRIERHWQAEVARAGAVLLCKPITYMNLSGAAARGVSDFYKISPAELLIVLDDMALPLGKLRLRPSGSSGGHNGLQSVLEHLGTESIARLRVGIGGAQPGEATGHVLGRFAVDERETVLETLERAVGAIETAQQRGLQSAMNIYN